MRDHRPPDPALRLHPCPTCGRGTRELVALPLSTGGAVVACRPCVTREAELRVHLHTAERLVLRALAAWRGAGDGGGVVRRVTPA